jgi:GNAT superfamily N-acetyltransferase
MADQEINAAAARRNYHATATLLDGSPIFIRAIGADDRERLLAHFDALSPQSVMFRFHGAKRSLHEDELARLTNLDFVTHVGLVATLSEERQAPLIGVARYIRSGEEHPARAEVGFAVLDQYQGKGIGSALLHHLALIGAAAGIKEFQADVMMNNYQMIEVLEHSGFKLKLTSEVGVNHMLLTIDRD